MIKMFFPYSLYPFKAMKIPSGYFFSKIKSPRTFYTRDDIYDYTRSVQMYIVYSGNKRYYTKLYGSSRFKDLSI
jgi:hypothetical protein